jgi:hypothetical protein
MHVIIKNIPKAITIQELETEILNSIKWMIFHKKSHINALKIIHLVDNKGVLVERFGLVRVGSEGMKKRLIKALNGRPMVNRRPFTVDEFVTRHWSHDRRVGSKANAPFNPENNMREYDRRRRGLNLVAYSEKSVGQN